MPVIVPEVPACPRTTAAATKKNTAIANTFHNERPNLIFSPLYVRTMLCVDSYGDEMEYGARGHADSERWESLL